MGSRRAETFKVLGVESRIRIIELLKRQGPVCVNEMSEVLSLSPSAVSQHLKVLKYAGLVRNERKGYWIHYEVDPAALAHCKKLLSRICTCGCRGSGRFREAEIEKSEDKLALLTKYERELRKELREVQARIKDVKREE